MSGRRTTCPVECRGPRRGNTPGERGGGGHRSRGYDESLGAFLEPASHPSLPRDRQLAGQPRAGHVNLLRLQPRPPIERAGQGHNYFRLLGPRFSRRRQPLQSGRASCWAPFHPATCCGFCTCPPMRGSWSPSTPMKPREKWCSTPTAPGNSRLPSCVRGWSSRMPPALRRPLPCTTGPTACVSWPARWHFP